MSNYYGSGLPCSDYIMHYGIKGQKWYNRRYQYDDGTLTPAGKERYRKGGGLDKAKDSKIANGAKAVGKVFGKGISRVGEGISRAVKGKLAEKVPWMLNDEELERYRYRAERENAFRKAAADRANINKSKESDTSKWVKQLARDVAGNTVKTLTSKGVEAFAEDHIQSKKKRKDEKRDDRMQEIRDNNEIDKLNSEQLKRQVDNAVNRMKLNMENEIADEVSDASQMRQLQSESRDMYRRYRSERANYEMMRDNPDRYTSEETHAEYSNMRRTMRDLDSNLSTRREITQRQNERSQRLKEQRRLIDQYTNPNKGNSKLNQAMENKVKEMMRNQGISEDEAIAQLLARFNNGNP